MATWRDFAAFVRSNYEVTRQNDETIQLIFDTEDGRSQVVYLSRRLLVKGTEEWLVIESPFGELGQVDLELAVREAGALVCGGVASVGKYVTFRHALPLINLDSNEFRRPLELVTLSADRLEHRVAGDDRY